MDVDLLRRTVGDSPMVQSIATGSTVALRQIGGNGSRRTDDLIGEAPQRRRDSADDSECGTGRFECRLLDDEWLCRERVGHDHLRVLHAARTS